MLIFKVGDYSDESEHLIPVKVDSRFDDDFLGLKLDKIIYCFFIFFLVAR